MLFTIILYIIDYLLGRYIPHNSIFYEIQNKKYKYLFTIILISVLISSHYKTRFGMFWIVYFSIRIIDKLLYLVTSKKSI